MVDSSEKMQEAVVIDVFQVWLAAALALGVGVATLYAVVAGWQRVRREH